MDHRVNSNASISLLRGIVITLLSFLANTLAATNKPRIVYEVMKSTSGQAIFGFHLLTRILIEKGIPIKPWKYNPTKTLELLLVSKLNGFSTLELVKTPSHFLAICLLANDILP